VNLKLLHEEFIEVSRRPMQFGKNPIEPQKNQLPIIAMNKWNTFSDPIRLSRTYEFRRKEDRSLFIKDLLDYEDEIGHHADIFITEDTVRIELHTKDIDQITEIDKEYAKYSDETYKEIVTSFKRKKDG